MNNFMEYAEKALCYEAPSYQLERDLFLRLANDQVIQEQFLEQSNLEEWKNSVESLGEVYYLIYHEFTPSIGKLPRLKLKYIGPEGGVPTITIHCYKTVQRPNSWHR